MCAHAVQQWRSAEGGRGAAGYVYVNVDLCTDVMLRRRRYMTFCLTADLLHPLHPPTPPSRTTPIVGITPPSPQPPPNRARPAHSIIR
ncbi:hypothetical protein J6590_034052 [Homalodisca vitripennis]|nr:hypothetical protein J6590_034052 [Homalodisca vitripennis]